MWVAKPTVVEATATKGLTKQSTIIDVANFETKVRKFEHPETHRQSQDAP